MSQLKKKLKLKDKGLVSQPLNFEHVQHLGPLDVSAAVGDAVANPPTPCQGPDHMNNNSSKNILKFLQSTDFQEALRHIVRDELEAERPKLLKEIATVRHLPSPCTAVLDAAGETYTSETNSSQSESVQNYSDMGHEDPNVSHRFENPLYDRDQTALKVKPSPAPRMTVNQSSSNGSPQLGINASKHRTGQGSVTKPRVALRMSKNDERECLSQALQANIVALVDRLQFNLSDLPDQLISSGHMTEDECRMLRNEFSSRKDQVRYLVSRAKCRDLKDIEKFLQLIDREIPDVVEKIRDQFEENKRNNVKCTTCALCQCANNVDIKDAVDILWSMRAVSDGFYNEVVACTKPRGSQETLWRTLIEICNGKQTKEKQKVFSILFEFIRTKGSFEFIVTPLKCMLQKNGRLDCHCYSSIKTSLSERGSYGVMSSCSPRSSWSESRQSTFDEDFNQESERSTELLEEGSRRDVPNTKKKLMHQQALDDDRTEETIPKQKLSHARSLEMLEPIREENSKTHRDFTSQTTEFHRSVHGKPILKKTVSWHDLLADDEDSNTAKQTRSESSYKCAEQFHELSGFSQNRSSEV